jgi:hypothetical protein
MVGLSVGIVCMPQWPSTRAKALFLTSFAALANLPDLHVPGWGHYRYDISHSLFVNLALVVAVAAALRIGRKVMPRVASWPVLVGGAFVWLIHVFLDSFYNHGQGLCILWPLSEKALALPMPWFGRLDGIPPTLSLNTFRVCSIELAFYLPFLLLAIYWRRRRTRRS